MRKRKQAGVYTTWIRLCLLAVMTAFAGQQGLAQQIPMYSQYIMNGFLINPSYAGADGYTSVNLTAREQWVGFKNAPRTHALSFQTRLLKTSYISKSTSVRKKIKRPSRSGNVGLGGYVFNDRNGIISRTGVQLTYAYHINLRATTSRIHLLSFGLSANIFQFALDDQGFILADMDDEYLNNYDRVMFIPDANFGVSYTRDEFYLGFSMTSILRSAIKFSAEQDNKYKELGHYFLTGGYNIQLPSDDWKVEPSVLIKTSDRVLKSMQVDLNTLVYYKEDYWAGLSYRTNNALIFIAGLRYDMFFFSYAFDFSFSDIRSHSLGTHEFSFAVKFGDNARRYRWLNRY